ncbi:MAG TPA: 2-isopropylmalate synthase [Burkholderiaceae bacterium]|nr:2-isopropylmalate synthase [Burkholderiaceae bacterium]
MTTTPPAGKYRPFPTVDLPDRRWPSRRIERAPRWLSTDLRDGNQALFEPMDTERKLRMFETLLRIGVKEIEVGFPAASQTDFDFVRHVIEHDLVPDDVTISVLTQAREDLIARSIESLAGARRATVHLYNATAPVFRRVVFGMTTDEVLELAVRSTRFVREQLDARPGTEWGFEYSPEVFSSTELPFALEVCTAVMEAWGATPARPVILNLPATVECATPNVYADQIEWIGRHLPNRESAVISVHPHNDRGTAVAAAELSVMAGADRVEGCLFGNGERTGNVDLVTLALNLYTQGVDPGLDFSDINAVARTVEQCNQLPIHPRHPYVGDLVFTAFSGSHQDAIKKGFAAQRPGAPWEVPYLPIDPADLGRSYESVIRVNSQSGKGGIAFLLERHHGLVMPRRLQVEFSAIVQRHTDANGTEVTADELWTLFRDEYLDEDARIRLLSHRMTGGDAGHSIELAVSVDGARHVLHGEGNGPIDAAVAALGLPLRVDAYEERSIDAGADARAVAFIEAKAEGVAGTRFGVGIDRSIVLASLRALLSAANRLGLADRWSPTASQRRAA